MGSVDVGIRSVLNHRCSWTSFFYIPETNKIMATTDSTMDTIESILTGKRYICSK